MSEKSHNLNEAQRQAVEIIDAPVAIIAGAGSGKTRVITHKILHLITNHGLKPFRVLAITFTNKAAGEMQARVSRMLGEEARLAIYTYHALGARILREDGRHVGLASNFAILDGTDQKQLLTRIYQQEDLSSREMSYSMMIEYISHFKNRHFNMEDIKMASMVKEGAKFQAALVKVYDLYHRELANLGAVDFDDLILLTEKLLTTNSQVASKWRGRFDYLLIDEFQDTAPAQYTIAKCLARPDATNLTIVGDPDQTIYTWRLADPSLIMNFTAEFPHAKLVKLEENYRSFQEILTPANLLIKHNPRRIDKNLHAALGGGGIVKYFEAFSDEDEARHVVNELLRRYPDRKINGWDQVVVLYRSNFLSRAIEGALIKDNFAYQIWGSVKFYQKQEIRDVLAFLKLGFNFDELSLQRVINVPRRKLGSSSIATLLDLRDTHGTGLWSLIKPDAAIDLPLGTEQKAQLKVFVSHVNHLHNELATGQSWSASLNNFLKSIDYLTMVKDEGEEHRLDNISEFLKSIDEWKSKHQDKTLEDFFEEIALYADIKESHGPGGVVLMTIHSAKGLEFDTVFVIGLSEGTFPTQRSLDEETDEGVEEERRLAYVAFTRARKTLLLSSSASRSFTNHLAKEPSRFLVESGIRKERKLRTGSLRFESESPERFESESSENVSATTIKSRPAGATDLIVEDRVIHAVFGEGVVVDVAGEIVKVAFRAPFGVKSLLLGHTTLQKMVNKE